MLIYLHEDGLLLSILGFLRTLCVLIFIGLCITLIRHVHKQTSLVMYFAYKYVNGLQINFRKKMGMVA